MSILPELLHFCSSRHPPDYAQERRLSDDSRVESSSRSSFIPPQIKDYGLGIPACLAKPVTIHRSKLENVCPNLFLCLTLRFLLYFIIDRQ